MISGHCWAQVCRGGDPLLGFWHKLFGSVVSFQFLPHKILPSCYLSLSSSVIFHQAIWIYEYLPKEIIIPILFNIPPFSPYSMTSHCLTDKRDIRSSIETSRLSTTSDITWEESLPIISPCHSLLMTFPFEEAVHLKSFSLCKLLLPWSHLVRSGTMLSCWSKALKNKHSAINAVRECPAIQRHKCHCLFSESVLWCFSFGKRTQRARNSLTLRASGGNLNDNILFLDSPCPAPSIVKTQEPPGPQQTSVQCLTHRASCSFCCKMPRWCTHALGRIEMRPQNQQEDGQANNAGPSKWDGFWPKESVEWESMEWVSVPQSTQLLLESRQTWLPPSHQCWSFCHII